MAKRDAGHGQISHKRHKTVSFVGLMGKRALNSVAYERSAMQNYERRRNKPCTHVSIHLHLCPRAVSGKIKMCAMRNDYFI
nr:protachykinin-1 isoform X2 [Rattus norvegicus]